MPPEVSSQQLSIHIRSVHFHVTHGAILKPRGSEIVKRGWNAAQLRVLWIWHGDVGVALQTNLALFVTHQHPGIRRAVRLMASGTTFQPHGRMFENKGSAFIAVAGEASGFIAEGRLHAIGAECGVRIVAIHAGHGAFGKPVFIRPAESSPFGDMAGGAAGVDLGFLVFHQFGARGSMDEVAGGTAHLILGMAASYAAAGCVLVQVAGEAGTIGFERC
jgi:hypothetical protein